MNDVERKRMGWIGLVIVACLALIIPIAVAVAASSSPVSTTAGSGSNRAGAAAELGARQKDARGPRADKPGKGNQGNQGPKGNSGQPGKGPISISAIDGAHVTLETVDGWTRTIAITDATVIIKEGAIIHAEDLVVGDVIRFRQVGNPDGTFTVDAIRVQPPRAPG